MNKNSFMSVSRERLIAILEDTPPTQVILVEKGVQYTAEQVICAVRHSEAGTMFHIPRPKD